MITKLPGGSVISSAISTISSEIKTGKLEKKENMNKVLYIKRFGFLR